jgi:hypothetical protein
VRLLEQQTPDNLSNRKAMLEYNSEFWTNWVLKPECNLNSIAPRQISFRVQFPSSLAWAGNLRRLLLQVPWTILAYQCLHSNSSGAAPVAGDLPCPVHPLWRLFWLRRARQDAHGSSLFSLLPSSRTSRSTASPWSSRCWACLSEEVHRRRQQLQHG